MEFSNQVKYESHVSYVVFGFWQNMNTCNNLYLNLELLNHVNNFFETLSSLR